MGRNLSRSSTDRWLLWFQMLSEAQVGNTHIWDIFTSLVNNVMKCEDFMKWNPLNHPDWLLTSDFLNSYNQEAAPEKMQPVLDLEAKGS